MVPVHSLIMIQGYWAHSFYQVKRCKRKESPPKEQAYLTSETEKQTVKDGDESCGLSSMLESLSM